MIKTRNSSIASAAGSQISIYDLCEIKRLIDHLRSGDHGGILGDWAHSVEIDYQVHFGLESDDWDFSPDDLVNSEVLNHRVEDLKEAEARLHRISSIVTSFDEECEDEEYTDPGDAWDLLNAIREIADGDAEIC